MIAHMSRRALALVVLSILLSLPAAAFDKGDVLFEYRAHTPGDANSRSYELWVHNIGWRYAVMQGSALIYKPVPYSGLGGHLLIPSPNEIVFHHQRTVSLWDGVPTRGNLPGKGYTEIFTADTELSEIAPIRSGNYLVAERWAEQSAKLIEFNIHGRIAEHPFPEVIDPATNRALGAMHIELLSDQCTVLYTLGSEDPAGSRVRRMNVCTNQAQTDFATLLPGQYAGSIRQLPNGNVLVANGTAVLQFDAAGSLVRTYENPGVTHLALSTDGKAFWAASVDLEKAHLRRFDWSAVDATTPPSIQLGNDGMQIGTVPLETSDLVVVGEWRASTRAARRGRAIRH